MPAAEHSGGWTAWVWPAVFAVHLLGVAPQLQGVWSDDAIYLDMARSLAAGEGLRLPSLPLGPETGKYPPGWPFLLSLFIRAGVDPSTAPGLFALHSLAAACWATAAQLVVSLLVPRLGGGRAAPHLVGLLLAINTVTMKTVPTGMSEGLFTALFTAAVCLGLSMEQRPTPARGLALALFTAAAALTRSVAAPLALVGVAAAAATRRWRLAGGLAFGWALQSAVVRLVRAGIEPLSPAADRVLHYYVSYREHVAYYSEPARSGDLATTLDRLGSTMVFNAALAADSLGSLLYPARVLGVDEAGGGLGSTALLGLVLVGAAVASAVRAPAARPVLALIIAYAGIFLAWTWPFSLRFWLPVFPLLLACAVPAFFLYGNIPRLLVWPLTALLVVGNAFSPLYRAAALFTASEVETAADLAAERQATKLNFLVHPEDVLLGPLHVATVARRLPAQSMELEALLPSADRLALMLGQASPVEEADRLAGELEVSLSALQSLLPADANAWVFIDPSLDSSGQRRMEVLVAPLVASGRLTLALDAPDARLWRVAGEP